MRRPILGTLFALACVSILVLPSIATAVPIHHHMVITRHQQVRVPDSGRLTTVAFKRQVTRVENVAPPYIPAPTPSVASQSSVSLAPAAPTTSSVPAPAAAPSGGYTIPDYIVQCESGGSYTAQNPSGAYGAYQIMPATSAAYGCDMSSPAGQDACAARIYSDVGSSAWSCG